MDFAQQNILEIAGVIVFILLILLGIPILILWIKDRGGVAGSIIQRVLGVVSLVFGLIILGWFVFNLFSPTEEFSASFRSVYQLALPAGMVWFGWHWLTSKGPGIESYPPNFDCQELRASIDKAKATLPWFIDRVNENIDGAFVKFPITTPNNYTEYIWGYVHNFRDGFFNVSLVNTPYDDSMDPTGRMDIPIDDIMDWQIMHPDGRINGAYSLIALFQHHESAGKRLTRTMREQKAQLLDAHDGTAATN